ncbi:MAG: EamA family transporter [Candidatus Liptonbacteria bacterium]|nr:EamA family transporter [Candidatus Liptonbacteria bacterium]
MQSIYFFAWTASILFGLETVIGKLIGKHSIRNPWFFNFIWTLLTLAFIVPVALINGVALPGHWGGILLASFFFASTSVLFIRTLFRLDVTVLSPLYSFRTAFAVLLGTIFLGEILTNSQYILIAIIFAAGLFVSIDERLKLELFFTPAIALALIYMLSLALFGAFTKTAVAETNYWSATLWIVLLGQIWLLPTIYFFRKEIRVASLKQYRGVLLVAIIDVIGTLAAYKAYAQNLSIAAAIISLPFSMLIAFLFSVFAPRLLEKHIPKVYFIRFAAAAIMIISALYLNNK